MKIDKKWRIAGFTMRLVEQNDKDGYYEGVFTNVDVETIRMTGSKDKYSKEELDHTLIGLLRIVIDLTLS